MKRFLFLLTAIPAIATAQQYQLGLNAGMYTTSEQQHGIYISPRATIERKDYFVGMAIDYSYVWGFWILGSRDRAAPRIYHKYSILSPNLSGNYKMALPKGYVYIGATLGYLYTNMGDTIISKQLREGTVLSMDHSATHSVAVGVQLGASIPVSKRFSINAECAARKTSAHKEGFIYFPLSLGLRCRLGRLPAEAIPPSTGKNAPEDGQ